MTESALEKARRELLEAILDDDPFKAEGYRDLLDVRLDRLEAAAREDEIEKFAYKRKWVLLERAEKEVAAARLAGVEQGKVAALKTLARIENDEVTLEEFIEGTDIRDALTSMLDAARRDGVEQGRREGRLEQAEKMHLRSCDCHEDGEWRYADCYDIPTPTTMKKHAHPYIDPECAKERDRLRREGEGK